MRRYKRPKKRRKNGGGEKIRGGSREKDGEEEH